MAIPAHSQIVMSAQTVDETTSTAWGPDILSAKAQFSAYVEWATGVSAGVVQIETASHKDYTGTWAPITGGNITSGTITFAGTAPNAQWFRCDGPFGAIRARISTAVADGTVTVTFFANS